MKEGLPKLHAQANKHEIPLCNSVLNNQLLQHTLCGPHAHVLFLCGQTGSQ